jgi:N,N'-diacetyllegionaminate synthase
LIIAEAGVNHNGDLELARRLIDVAAQAGADFVKFQTFSADRLASRFANKAPYQRDSTPDTGQLEMLRSLELDRVAHEKLVAHCRDSGIGFLSAAFDQQSVDLLAELGIDRFKIPSGEITNLPYLRHVASYRKPIILSSGMATLGEIEDAIAAFEGAGARRTSITVLHCSTEYPTAMTDVNLRAMLSIREAFGVAVGYSDHTRGIEIPIAAVALGATVIEKHFTLDRTLPGPDHGASLEPREITAMVRAIRNIEEALGDGIKRPMPGEIENRSVVRKSLVAAVPIKAGEVLTSEKVAAKRPGTGISPMLWDQVIGKRAPREFAPDELIEL